ncbi:MAG: hypothetical protein JST84_31835 [Acidobacteria bacterium]|nr:hypothetical protein [Acidobacteriota bacterium]
MAIDFNEQNPTNQIPYLRHDLTLGEETATVALKQFEFSPLRAKVDEIIDRGFSDMWLLLDGEEFDRDVSKGIWRDGRAFAMVVGDQVCLLGPKFSAINALLSVGVSMV